MSELNPPDTFTELTRLKNGSAPSQDPAIAEWASSIPSSDFEMHLQRALEAHADPFEQSLHMRDIASELDRMVASLKSATRLHEYRNLLRNISYSASAALAELRAMHTAAANMSAPSSDSEIDEEEDEDEEDEEEEEEEAGVPEVD